MVKETLIFKREETQLTDLIGADEFRGYGHNFDNAFMVPKIKGRPVMAVGQPLSGPETYGGNWSCTKTIHTTDTLQFRPSKPGIAISTLFSIKNLDLYIIPLYIERKICVKVGDMLLLESAIYLPV